MRTGTLAVMLTGLACGPERPPAMGSYASPPPSPASPGRDLPASAYRVAWGPVRVPATLGPGERTQAEVTFTNSGSTAWPASGRGEPREVRLGQHWRRDPGEPFTGLADRTELPGVVPPGGTVSLTVDLVAPRQPGDYVVEFDLLHDGVSWFSARGAATQRAAVQVR